VNISLERQITRRRILQHGLAGTFGAIAAPQIISRSALAADNQPAANDRIGLAIIGCGRRGVTYFAAPVPRAQVVATCDVNLKRAEQTAQNMGCSDFVQDYRRILDRKDVDGVMIAAPDHWHALIAIAACQAGKHVYVDKPMTMCVVEGRCMVEAARKYNRIVQVGSQQRSIAPNRDGCALIRNGGIGKVTRAITAALPSAWFCEFPAQPVPAELDWEMWCGPSRLLPYHLELYSCDDQPGWMECRDYGVGTIGNWGGHGIDQVQWALGTDATGPVEVLVNGPALVPPIYTKPESKARGWDICSKPALSFRYASGTLLELSTGSISGAIFEGEKGKVEIRRGSVHSNPVELIENVQLPDGSAHTQAHINNWLDSIDSKFLPVADVEIGHRTATICHLGNIGRLLGRNLRWDPVAERFIDDDQANQMLDRPRRKGYELPELV
jgi:predicted dehydrogenase